MLGLDLCEAMRVKIRYDIQDEKQETRRERNEKFGHGNLSEPLIIPENGLYLWNYFWEISGGVLRAGDGVCNPITWQEFLAWSKITQNELKKEEFEILRNMDLIFVECMNLEIKAYRERKS